MDLKALLLYSLSSRQTIQSQKRIILGKLCFCISYQMTGKHLTVTRIRRCQKKKQSVRHQKTLLRESLLQKSSNAVNKKSKTITWNPILAETEIQTITNPTTSQGIECNIELVKNSVPTQNRTQQTICKFYHSRAIQTDINVTVQANQTEQSQILSQSQQTESNLITTSTQTSVNSYSNDTQTDRKWFCSIEVQTENASLDFQNSAERLQVEKEAIILLLNEIGEMIINQNHLMHNNSRLLQQISDMTLLNKMVTKQNSAIKSRERFERLCKFRKILHKHKKTRYIFFKAEPKETRDKWVQVILLPESVDNFTQTITIDSSKKKKSWIKKK